MRACTKENMEHYLILPKVFLCFVAVGVLSGCNLGALVGLASMPTTPDCGTLEVETRGAWDTTIGYNCKRILPISMITLGKTTKNDVLAMLSIPEEKTIDDQFFLYRYEMQWYNNARKEDENVVERMPVGRLSHARFLIWFDQTDIVKRHQWHDCIKSVWAPTSARKCDSTYQMCEMIKGLKEEQLIAQYC